MSSINAKASTPPPDQFGIDADRYLALFEALSPLIGSHDVDALCAAASRLLADVLGVEACSIFLHDPTGDVLTLRGATHIEPEAWSEVQVPTTSGLCGQAFARAEPILLTEAKQFEAFDLEPKSRYGKASCIVSPLIVREEPHGVVTIANPTNGRIFTEGDLKLITAAARLVAGGIQNAYQFRETVLIHEQLEGIFDNLQVGVLALSPDLVITHSNQRLRELRGRPNELLRGRPLKDVLASALFHVCQRLIRDATSQRKVTQDRVMAMIGGNEILLEVTVSRVDWSGAAPEGCLLMIEDISATAEIERLRATDSLKSGFLRIISHELRTPLTVIRASMPLLESCCEAANGGEGSTLNKVEKLIKGNVQKLSGLVNAILDVVEIENGSFKLAIKPFDLNGLVGERLAAISDEARPKRLVWDSALCERLEPVHGDRHRIGQAIHELLLNAIKFSPHGETVLIQTSTEAGEVVLRVGNTGEAIEPENRQEVFEKFYQIDTSTTRKTGGCGLGLFLVSNIARLHGGSVKIEDHDRFSTVFALRLPLAGSSREIKS